MLLLDRINSALQVIGKMRRVATQVCDRQILPLFPSAFPLIDEIFDQNGIVHSDSVFIKCHSDLRLYCFGISAGSPFCRNRA